MVAPAKPKMVAPAKPNCRCCSSPAKPETERLPPAKPVKEEIETEDVLSYAKDRRGRHGLCNSDSRSD